MLAVVFSGYPFHEGSGTSNLVPYPYEVAFSGAGFNIDRTYPVPYRHEPLPLLREQADSTDQPGERSINRQSLWRSSSFSWHGGAGQLHLDRQTSSPYRFRTSRGIDPWTRWQFSLLPDTTLRHDSSPETNQILLVVGTNLILLEGSAVYKSADGVTFTALTSAPSGDWVAATTDGTYVYASDGADIYRFLGTATTIGAAWSTQDCTTLTYINGWLLAGKDATIYSINNAGTATSTFVHNFADFEWVGFTHHSRGILAAGYSGIKSEVYRLPVDEATGALGVGIPAGALPDGERVYAIGSYLDFILLGTSNGIRFAAVGDGGGLVIGAYIETPEPVLTFEGQESFVYFGWSNFDATYTGLGRLDLQTINDDAPAYASDIMAASQGSVRSTVTFLSRLYFAVSGDGIYAASDDLVEEGYLYSGRISYDLSDDKIAMFADLKFDELAGEIDAYISTPSDADIGMGSATTAGSTSKRFSALQRRGEWLELKLVLTRDATTTTTGPSVTRFTLLSNPTTDPGTIIYAPVIIADDELTNGVSTARDTSEVVEFLKGLYESGTLFTYQERDRAYTVVMRTYEWRPLAWVDGNRGWNGTFLAVLLTV